MLSADMPDPPPAGTCHAQVDALVKAKSDELTKV